MEPSASLRTSWRSIIAPANACTTGQAACRRVPQSQAKKPKNGGARIRKQLRHDPGGTRVSDLLPTQHHVPIPRPPPSQRTSLAIPMMKHQGQTASGHDDSSPAVGHSEPVLLDCGNGTQTSYTPSRTSPRCLPPVSGTSLGGGRRRTAGIPLQQADRMRTLRTPAGRCRPARTATPSASPRRRSRPES